jgi:hypothetical protein
VLSVGVVPIRDPYWLAGASAASFLIHAAAWGGFAGSARATAPVAVFSFLLFALQVFYGQPDPRLAAKTLSVFWLTSAAFRLVPWIPLSRRVLRGSRLAGPAIFLLFLRHFALILTGEARRLLTARRIAVGNPYGRWALRSLTAGLASLFLRAIVRAERFYAARIVTGAGE